MDEFNIEASMREDIYILVQAAWEREKKENKLDPESKRLLEKERKSYITNGLGIEKGPKRDRFKEIKKRMSMVCDPYLSLPLPSTISMASKTFGGGIETKKSRFKSNSKKTSTRRMAESGSLPRN